MNTIDRDDLDKMDECTPENPCRECLKKSIAGYKELVRELEEKNRKLQEERDEWGRTAQEAIKTVFVRDHQLQSAKQEIEQLKQERAELIERLRKLAKTNAENISEIREWKAKQNDPEVTDLDWYNYVARDILKEIGVTNDEP